MRYWDWFGDGSLVVGVLGLACCVVETEAATLGRRECPLPVVRTPSLSSSLAR